MSDSPQNSKIANLATTRRLLQAHELSAKKSLGQNFIVEPSVIARIIASAGADREDLVLEIGPGLGSLTQALAEAAGQVLALEIDQSLIPALHQSLGSVPNLHIMQADAMEADLEGLLAAERAKAEAAGISLRPGFLTVANLPYYITTPLIMRLLTETTGWRRLVFMVQKELAARIQARPGSKDYGALSLAVQYRAAAKIAFSVPAGCFLPRPKVDSAVIVLDRLAKPPVETERPELLFAVIRAGFNQRRKTILNALASVLDIPKPQAAEALAASGIPANRRAENLALADFARIADKLPANFIQNTKIKA